MQGFVSNWTDLVTEILAQVPEAKGRIILDLINEPDGYKFDWCASGPCSGHACRIISAHAGFPDAWDVQRMHGRSSQAGSFSRMVYR